MGGVQLNRLLPDITQSILRLTVSAAKGTTPLFLPGNYVLMQQEKPYILMKKQ